MMEMRAQIHDEEGVILRLIKSLFYAFNYDL